MTETARGTVDRPTGREPYLKDEVLADYRVCVESREASLIGRREVLSGKAKFGIFGDGKEVAQAAMARAARKGDIRAGYYRDQTFMLALGLLTLDQFFAQLYADPSVERDPASAGRQMNAHFATRMLEPDGSWKRLLDQVHSAADLSPTGSQMPKLVGLAYASRLYRELDSLRELDELAGFSDRGNEVAWGAIGNASCAEGMFWESVNAVGVLGGPLVLSIWDDGYGISVPNEYQVAKGDLSELLKGFGREEPGGQGYDLYRVRGWDYPALRESYARAAEVARREHVPAILHIAEMTQPQGHSTSGSHERYKSKERLAWEEEFDCLRKMREWMLEESLATAAELDRVEEEGKRAAREAKQRAWDAYRAPLEEERRAVLELVGQLAEEASDPEALEGIAKDLERRQDPFRRDILGAVERALIASRVDDSEARRRLVAFKRDQGPSNEERYSSHLTSESERSALAVRAVPPEYADDAPTLNGFEILNRYFDVALERHPHLIAFGEDVGKLGDVNQGMAGLQAKYGELRVCDTGIRETTILGQAIGMALRGLRPIAEIQYLDYVLYCLQIMSDDLASLHYRTKGGQKAPVIIRTRGHRLEGIWHSGSPMAGILNLVRGMWVCVPRDMTRAAGMYQTLLDGDEPAILVEVLNGYRLKERLPSNLGDYKVPLGVPEILREGDDLTIATYGACCRIVLEAAELLAEVGIEAEVVDVQTLLPFDRDRHLLRSVQKTNRLLVVDEDVPGGASAYIVQQIVEGQGAFWWLDSPARTLAAKAHRPPYGSDGDYFSKPNREQVFETAYEILHEADPKRFPIFY